MESITELVTLIEVTEQAYLKAARQVDPVFTAAALGRLAHLSQDAARRLAALPPALTSSAGIQEAMGKRVKQLEKSAQDALAACAELAWTRQVFNAATRACLLGQAPARDPVGTDALSPRTPAPNAPGLDEPRARLARDPEDVEALRALGEILLDAGDAHVARLAFARASQVGGGPVEANLLGLASHRAGDKTGALEAFARAAAGGLEAGRQNLAATLREPAWRRPPTPPSPAGRRAARAGACWEVAMRARRAPASGDAGRVRRPPRPAPLRGRSSPPADARRWIADAEDAVVAARARASDAAVQQRDARRYLDRVEAAAATLGAVAEPCGGSPRPGGITPTRSWGWPRPSWAWPTPAARRPWPRRPCGTTSPSTIWPPSPPTSRAGGRARRRPATPASSSATRSRPPPRRGGRRGASTPPAAATPASCGGI
ncbi:MAG: hypothetical protein R3F60_22695 [bacterium]